MRTVEPEGNSMYLFQSNSMMWPPSLWLNEPAAVTGQMPPARFPLSTCFEVTDSGPALNVHAGKIELGKTWRR